jgi:hypothetical protein
MVWPIIRGKSYVGESGKSTKAVGMGAVKRVVDEMSPVHHFGPMV